MKDKTNPLNILTIGAGAVGAFYSGKLAQQGATVSVVCRSEYDAVNQHGFSIQSPLGDFQFKPHHVFKSVQEVQTQLTDNQIPHFDLIIVTTKVLPEINPVELLTPVIQSTDTAILLLQNGINIEPEVHQSFPKNELISGLAFVCLNRLGDGKIHHQDYGRLVIGNYPSECSDLCQYLAIQFTEAGIHTKASEEIQYDRWKKLLWNAPFNPLSVVTGGKNTKEIIEDPDLYSRSKSIMKEVQSLAQSEGITLEDYLIEKNLTDTLKMTPYKTSMLLDHEAGRPLESEAILGNAIAIGTKNNIQTPFISELYDQLTIIQNR